MMLDSQVDYTANAKFDFDQDPDPIKRRKKNIKRAKKFLKPARKFGFIRFNEPGQCCVTGIMLSAMGPDAYDVPLLDPDTMRPLDDGRTLATQFFRDQLTGKIVPFTALSSIDSGYMLRSGYSPELLMIYWLLSQWKLAQHVDNQSQHSVWLWKKRNIKLNANQKPGIANPKTAKTITALSIHVFIFQPANTPIGIPNNRAINIPENTVETVASIF